MKNLFSSAKKSSKAPPAHDDQNSPNASSPTKSSTKSSSKSTSKKTARAASPGRKDKERDAKPRSSRSFNRPSTDTPSSSRSRQAAKLDLNTHPLNLPPEERKRYSTLSSMTEPMDIDESAAASSPQPSSPPAQSPSFAPPTADGTKDATTANGTDADAPPVPPPHRTNAASPGPSAAERAEICKADGNKAFKDKDYPEAIKYYSQGMPPFGLVQRGAGWNIKYLREASGC
jgi:DnaJ homolog subfamily C member 7